MDSSLAEKESSRKYQSVVRGTHALTTTVYIDQQITLEWIYEFIINKSNYFAAMSYISWTRPQDKWSARCQK